MLERAIRMAIQEEVAKELEKNRYKLRINMKFSTHITALPFPPFIGLQIDACGARVKFKNVFWNYKENLFEIEVE